MLQIYIIRVNHGGTVITAVYALLQRKTQATYDRVFTEVNNACVRADLNHPQPGRVHCDFEIAAHQAIRRIYPQTAITGCFYHLTQVNNKG